MKVLFPNGYIGEVSDAIGPVMIHRGECVALTERPAAPSSVKGAEKQASGEVKALKDPAPYRKQISNLENKLKDAIKAVPAAEKSLAEAYAGEDDAAIRKAHAALNEARDSRVALLGALKETDRLYYEANAAAMFARHAEIRAESHRAFWKVEPTVRAAGASLEKVLREIDEKGTDFNVEKEVVAPMLDRVWQSLEVRTGAKIAAVGYPKRLPTRDENGNLQGLEG